MCHFHRICTILASLPMIACGPPRLGNAATDENSTTGDATSADSTSADSTSSVGETSTEPAETSGDGGTSAEFTPRDDITATTECDPWMQDCPDGEKCVPDMSSGGVWDDLECVPIMGDAKPGEPCTYGGTVDATDDCDATGMCFDVDEIDGELIGTCYAFCTGTPDIPECPETSTCALSGDGVLTLCFPDCDPIAQDCLDGEGCYWSGSRFMCVPSAENLPAGESCEFANSCAVGLICAGAEALPDCPGVGCCVPFCELELGDMQCEAVPGTSCVSFYEEGMAPPGHEHIGVCISP